MATAMPRSRPPKAPRPEKKKVIGTIELRLTGVAAALTVGPGDDVIKMEIMEDGSVHESLVALRNRISNLESAIELNAEASYTRTIARNKRAAEEREDKAWAAKPARVKKEPTNGAPEPTVDSGA